uniref:DNA mismatch repair protein MutS connector domain-containing protein n=1 Tax=Panagrolaimus sp. PS1159 TaxID=55785 RepID=A0AC35GQ96_9BILA
MALVKEQISTKTSVCGLCFIDKSVGKFIFTQFEDDNCRSVLRTVAAQFQPSHVIYPKSLISSGIQAVFNTASSQNISSYGITSFGIPFSTTKSQATYIWIDGTG